MLTTASIIGREFELILLNSVLGDTTEDQLLTAMDEAVTAQLIEELPQSMGLYQFTHALIQESLSEELSSTRNVRLHALIAVALEGMYGDDTAARAAELAHHFAEAQAVLGAEKLVHYSLIAGERALAAYAYEDALVHFERGLAARDITLSGNEAASDEEAAGLLFGLARAQSATVERHRDVEAFAILSRAFEYYAEAGNVGRAVAAAEFPIATPGTLLPGVAELMARALALVPADSLEAGRLLSRYGGILGAVDYEGAHQALGRAMAIARSQGNIPLEVQALTYAANVDGQHLRWQECVDNGLRAINLAIGDENTFSGVVSRWWTATGLLRIGRLDEARPHVLVLRDLAENRTTPRQLAGRGFAANTYLAVLEGDWKPGREYGGRGLEISPLNPQLLLPLVLLEHETGEFAQGEIYLERLLEAMHRAGPDQLFASGRASMAVTATARITGDPSRLEVAAATAQAVLSARSVLPIFAINASAALALLAVHQFDRSAAEEHYAYLVERRNTMIWSVSSVDRLLGLLSGTMGNLDQAAAHFEDALTFCRKAGYRPELSWTCHDYADALIDRTGPGDRATAATLLDESLLITNELGMRPLLDRVTALQEKAESQPAKSPAYPDGLTEREVEVLRLVAAGRSNPEIGEVLFISPRTVTTHVSNILNKINAANRAEAAAYASRQGLA